MTSPVKIWRRQKNTVALIGKKGRVVSWTKIRVAATSFKQFAPYPVVLVEFENGERVFGALVDYENKDLKTGRKVISVLRRVRQPSDDGVIAYGIKFKPL